MLKNVAPFLDCQGQDYCSAGSILLRLGVVSATICTLHSLNTYFINLFWWLLYIYTVYHNVPWIKTA